MMQALLQLSLLLAQDAPWRTDVQAAREEARRDGRACVILLYADNL